MKLEVLVVPVSDVDRAKRFYEKLGCTSRATTLVLDVPGWPGRRRADARAGAADRLAGTRFRNHHRRRPRG